MVSLFSSLNIAAGSLTSHESAISVVSHNVANMNTEGYHKQRVNFATRNIAGVIGNNVQAQIRANGGVMIANVQRYNDEFLNNYYRDQLSKLNEYGAQLNNLGELAEIFNDLDGKGINGALSDFYKALNNLQEYPASSTARINFIETAKTLVSNLNSKNQQLGELTNKVLGDGVSQEALENSQLWVHYQNFNNKLTELAEVNKALQCTQTGTLEANNLLDKRDLILNDIAQFVDIRVKEHPNGSVNLYIGDTAMVKGANVVGELSVQTAADFEKYCQDNGIDLPDDFYNADGTYKHPAIVSIKGDLNIDFANNVITGGALGGLLHGADTGVDGMNAGKAKEFLNNLSQAIANVFNDLNTREGAYHIDPNDSGKLSNDHKIDIFVSADGAGDITAGNIAINPELLTDEGIWYIACAFFGEGENFDENAVGNAQNVAAMLGTRTQKSDLLNNQSFEDYYTSLLGKIAATGDNMQTLYDTQEGLVDSIYNQLKSATNVDLNEELVDLVKYQTAYAAAAQVFNTCNTCLDTLMTLGR